MVTRERVPAAVEALVEALESDLLQQELLLAALQESAGSGVPACPQPGGAAYASARQTVACRCASQGGANAHRA